MSGGYEQIARTSFTEFPDLKLAPLSTANINRAEDAMLMWLGEVTRGQITLEQREFIGIDQITAKSTFVDVPEMGKGRRNNHHQVMFGQLIIESQTDQEMPTLVAVKPHDEIEELVHEWVLFDALNQLTDDQQSYVPLGMWRDERGQPQMLTLYEHDVQSFDNLFWRTGREAATTPSAMLVKGYELMFWELGILHGAGLVQRDASVRNFARDTKRVRFNDVEAVDVLKRVKGNSIAVDGDSRRFVRRDMMALLASSVSRSNSSDEPIMLKKLMTIIRDKDVQEQVFGHYQGGVQLGNMRSGMNAHPSLYFDFQTFVQATAKAIELELGKYDEDHRDHQDLLA